ncbi:hypothetical protein ACFWPQ_38640 [Streptomyces sp. NPDC058464]|uniref:hypothetical protein n=1 Tax=Streptomyces sp. NPDC058464 TaxID=3346511 RepID=UPI00365F45F7
MRPSPAVRQDMAMGRIDSSVAFAFAFAVVFAVVVVGVVAIEVASVALVALWRLAVRQPVGGCCLGGAEG